MIEAVLLLGLVGLAVMVLQQGSRVKALSRRIDLLEREGRRTVAPAAIAAAEAPAVSEVAAVPQVAEQPWVARPEPVPPSAPAPQRAWQRPNFESLIGARLPVWIGAVALIAAGFFLVRYAIESGLLGPGVRTFAAGLFALALVVASEAARRFPATADDPRIAQALAGAGIASAYGALYLAAALYHLVPPLPAFVVMLAVTALALFSRSAMGRRPPCWRWPAGSPRRWSPGMTPPASRRCWSISRCSRARCLRLRCIAAGRGWRSQRPWPGSAGSTSCWSC